MDNTVFSIIDIETTGGGITGNRITEICMVRFQNGVILEKFVSLVNPQAPIPQYITALTGISDDMVADAPTFKEIADIVHRFTEDTVFVAHNVNFDYNVLKMNFRNWEEILAEKNYALSDFQES